MNGIVSAWLMNNVGPSGWLSRANVSLYETLVSDLMPALGAPTARWVIEKGSRNGYAASQAAVVTSVWLILETTYRFYPLAFSSGSSTEDDEIELTHMEE